MKRMEGTAGLDGGFCGSGNGSTPLLDSTIPSSETEHIWRSRWKWLKAKVISLWHSATPPDLDQPTDELTPAIRHGVFSRYIIGTVVMLGCLLLLGIHLFNVQVTRHEHFCDEALTVCQRSQTIHAARGRILDMNGNVFACDIASLDVFAEPRRFKAKIDVAAEIIARHLDLGEEELRLRLGEVAAYNRFEMLVSDQAVDAEFVSKNQLSQLPGVFVEPVESEGKLMLKVKYRPGVVDASTRTSTCRRLAEIFDLEADEVIDRCSKVAARCREVVIQRRASKEDAERMYAELKRNQINAGIRLEDSWIRTYPKDSVLANMLGYLDDRRSGVSGIESLMNGYLAPVDGKVKLRLDRRRRPVDGEVKVVEEAHDGADVYLTIEEPLQQIVEEELAELCRNFDPVRAYAIMVDPATGAVMALAQYPQFNPNDRQTMTNPDDWQNHCLLQNYDPGSIMKAVSLSGVLEARVAGLNSKVDCEQGLWFYGGRKLSDSHGYDILTLSEVIKKSSNIGTAKFAIMMGDEALYDYLGRYQLDRRTNLGFHPAGGKPVCFPMEYTGGLPALRHWSKVSITRIPIGQGVSLTPMQMIQSWMALANNGVIMQPYIVDRVRYSDGRTEYSQPKVKATPVASEAVRQMTEALITVTQKDGTGRRAAIEGYDVAGKTGTAQLMLKVQKGVKKDGSPRYVFEYAKNQYLASFIGFAPAERPRFLLLVSAENPRKGAHSGSGVAAPVFRKIASRTLQYLQVPPNSVAGEKRSSENRNASLYRSSR